MADANAKINIDINTSAAAAGLRQLQSQITAFNSTLTKSSAVQATAMRNSTQNMLELVNASRFFSAEQVKMQTAASSLDKTLSKGQVTIGQYLGARFKKNTLAAAQVMSLAQTRASALQTQFVATGVAANGMRDAIAIRPLQAFNNAAVVSAQKLAIQRAMLQQATTQMINFGKNTQWAGRQLMVGFTVPLTIFAGVAGKTFMDLEREAVNFKKVYGDSFTPPEEMQANLDAVKELAKEYTKYGIAVKDTVGLAAEAAAAGAQNAELLEATTQATRLATLGQMEQNEALKTTISLQNAFKLSGDDLANSINFLNMVENQTVVTLQDLSGAIPRVAPVIKGLGGDVRDLATFLAAMQEGGVSAAQGAQALKSGLASLINPTDKAKEKLAEMGVSIDTIIQANKGDLMGTVQALAAALDTLDQFGRQQAIEQLFGKFQYARLAALFDNINKEGTQAARVMEITAMSAGEMAASAEKELSAIEEAVGTKFTAAMEKLQLAIAPIGELFLKMAIPVVNFFTSVLDKFNQLPDFAKTFSAFAAVIIGIVIPTGTMFLGLLMNLVGTLIKFGSLVGTAFKGFTSGGFKGAFDAVSQSIKYMSLAEMDAVNSAQQLAGSTEAVNQAFLEQVTASDGAQAAVMELAYAYEILTQQMREAAAMNEVVFGTGAAAMGAAGRRGPIRRNRGGTIPGSGNTDTVPAMLTPGEFVVNKQATQQNLGLLRQINEGGKVPGFNLGGLLAATGTAVRSRSLLSGPQVAGALGVSERTLRRLSASAGLPKPGGRYLYTPETIPLLAAQTNVRMQKTHTTPFRSMTSMAETIPGSSQRAQLSKLMADAGIPIQVVDDAWLLLPSGVNQKLRAGGIQGSQLLEAIEDFSRQPGFFGPAYRNVDREGFISNLRSSIRPDAMYTDYGQGGGLNAGALFWSAARKSAPQGGFIPTQVGGYTANTQTFRNSVGTLNKKYAGQYSFYLDETGKKPVMRVFDSKGNRVLTEDIQASAGWGFNKGNIVPGQGNKDTVPAMLTPGEFVVNKKATQSNMALLKAINDGSIRGYAAGDIVGDKRSGFYAEGTNGLRSGPFPTRRMARKESRQIRSALGISRRSGMGGMRGMGMGMGMGMAGGAMFMGAGMMPNQGAATAMQAGGTALSIASMLPMLGVGGPVTLAVAGIAAAAVGAGVAIKAWRESVDNAARSAAEFGANLGGTANALNTISELTGQQTPLQRRRQVELGITNAEMETIMSPEMSAMLTSEKGQALIEELKSVTSAERFQKLADYLKSAIASGLMDRKMATAFAKAVSFEVQDSLLGRKTAAAISSQETGSKAFLELAQRRGSAADPLFKKFENEFEQAAKNVRTGLDASLQEVQDSIKISGPTPSQVVGLAMQGIQDYANVQALAQEEFAEGTISLQEFTKITKEASGEQQRFTTALKSAIEFSADPGAVMQGAIDQLKQAGFTEEDVKSLEDAAKVRATGADFSVSDAREASQGLKGIGIAALQSGTDLVTVNSALRDLADTATEGTNAMRIAFDEFGNLPDAIAKVSISGLLGGQVPVEAAQTQAALDEFIKGGGDTGRLQGMLASMSQQEAAQTFGNLTGLGDPAQQNQFMSDFESITEIIDSEYATQIVNSKEYLEQLGRGQTTLIDNLEEASSVFGEATKDIVTYANNTDQSLQKLTQSAKDLQGLSDEQLFRLGIDTTNIQDLEKFGPLAEDLKNLWPVLSNLPEEINLRSFVNQNISENGQLKSAKEFADQVFNVRKALDDLASTDPKIVKEATISLMVTEGSTQVDALSAFDMLLADMQDFNDFQPESKLFVVRAAVDLYNAIQALEALKNINTGDLDGGLRALRIAQEQQVADLQAGFEGQVQGARSGRPTSGSRSGSGGGTPEKTLAQELFEQAKASQKMFSGLTGLMDTRGFKKFIAGPFAPEFLEYLRSQGEKGLKLIKGGLDKVKKAYSNFIADRSAQMAAEAAIAPMLRREEMNFMQKEIDIRRQLSSQGRPQEEIDFIVENTMEKEKQIAANKKLIKETDNTTKAGKKRIENLRTHNQALRTDIKDVKANAKAYIELQKAMQFAGMSMREIDTLIYNNSEEIKGLERRLEELSSGGLIDLEKQVSAQQKIADGINRTIELRQRDADAIGRAIELKQRELDPIDDAIEKYEEQISKIEESYDIQLQALDDVAKAEENLARIREGRLDVANALSRGDVAGAAQAAVEMRRRFAEQQQEATREALEARRQQEIDAIQGNIKQKQEERKVIEQEIERLQLSQRDVQDDIYRLQQSMVPVQDEIYRLNTLITDEADRLDDKYRDAAAEVRQLERDLAAARDRAIELANARRDAGAGGNQNATTASPTNRSNFENLADKVVAGTATQSETDQWYNQLMANINAQYGMGGKVRKYAMGGMISYKGSREPAPGMMMGGKVKKYAAGGFVPGIGMTDKVPALLTPGEFVVRKSVAQQMMPQLKDMNSQVFPGMGVPERTSFNASSPQFDAMKNMNVDSIRFGVPQNINSYVYPQTNLSVHQTNMETNPVTNAIGPTNVQYNYNLNVSAKTNASADEIANSVMYKIKRFDDRRIKGTEIG